MSPWLRLNKCTFESISSEICGRPEMLSFLFSSSCQCHLSVASRGCSKSIALLVPKVTPFLFFLKFDILGNMGRRGSGFHELAASTGVCLLAWPNSPNSLRILNQNILKHYSDDDDVVVSLQGYICEINFNQQLSPRELSIL